MTRCEVCDGEDFEVQDGLYYCTMCQTQSQDLVEEEHFEGDFDTPSASCTARKLRIHTKQIKAAKVNVFGNMWTTHDAYNLILLNQVKALISLGASRELKIVVLNLWTRYLEKSCVAYLKKKKSRRLLSLYPRLRDIEVIVGQSPEVISKVRLHKTAAKFKKQKTASFSANPRSESEASVDGHYPSESDTMTDYGYLSDSTVFTSDAEITSDSDASVKISRRIKRVATETKHLTAGALGRSIQRMSLSLTLSFLYLGLLLLKEQILLSDILRWAWEDKIPFYNTKDIFPDDMKFQLLDNCTFKLPHAITHERVRLNTGHLAKYLGIAEIARVPVTYIAARFIKELCLPDVMFCMISNLISAYPTDTFWEYGVRGKFVIPNYEGIAVAYIILALKLLFGLNGKSEWIISDYCKVLMKKQALGNLLLFDFCEWRKHTSIKYWLSSLNWRRSIRTKIVTQSADLNELIRFYLDTGYKWRGKFRVDRTQKQKNETKMQNLYEDICTIFSMLSNAPILQRENRASSFPLHSEADDVHAKFFNFSCQAVRKFQKLDFSRTSLDFLLKSPKCNVTNDKSSMKACKKTKKRLKKIRKPYSKLLKAYKKYHPVNFNLHAIRRFYQLEADFPMLSSTSWLINLLAYILEMKRYSILQEVTLLESSIFKHKRKTR